MGYALGYFGAYSLIGVSIVLVGYQAAENQTASQSNLAPIITIVLGSLLLWLSLSNWRKPAPDEKKESRFFSIIDTITPFKAFGFGALVSVINFKNLALFLSALSVVIISNLQVTDKIIIALLVAFVFCQSVIIPVLICLLVPKKANQLLNGIKDWLGKHSRAIGIWFPLIFGLIFLLKGFTGLR